MAAFVFLIVGVVLSYILDDPGVHEVGLRGEALDQQCNQVTGLPRIRSHFNALIQIVLGVDFVVGIVNREFAGVERMKRHPRIVYGVLEGDDVLLG